MLLDLFQVNKTDREINSENVAQIKGLGIYPEFISLSEEKALLDFIDQNDWLPDLKRRVQHYGYKYDYKARKILPSSFIGKLPAWLDFLIDRLLEKCIIDFRPDQAIINEYVQDQGISSHIDCEPCFGEAIVSLSLGGSCIMNFEKEPNSRNKVPLLLIPRTLLIMQKEARYNWYHSIPGRKTDEFNGRKIPRRRRISITFRKVVA